MARLWMVRAGGDGQALEDFLQTGVVGLKGKELGPFTPGMDKAAVLARLRETRPDEKEATRAAWAAQHVRFLSEMQVGDGVVTYDQEKRVYYLGIIKTGYEWLEDLALTTPHARRVEWQSQIPRDSLQIASKNCLGATQSLFLVNRDTQNDLFAHRLPLNQDPSEAQLRSETATLERQVEVADLLDEMVEKAESFVEDAINALSWQGVQELVAGLLRAMGYRADVAAPGPDRGVDIFASPDGLGLQEPRIYVEVKHRSGAMGASEIRAFLGGRRSGDRCLYVSTGGFTREARYEAERSPIPLTLINLPTLRKLLVERYEDLAPETAALVPLRRVYWPVKSN